MRIARYSVAALVTFALTAGLTEVGLHGPAFFAFRQGGTGVTAGNETDQQFLAQQAHHPAKGRHVPPKHAARAQKR